VPTLDISERPARRRCEAAVRSLILPTETPGRGHDLALREIIAVVHDAYRPAVLELVDRVLRDLAPRDGMFVSRRDGEGDAGTVVIQTGEDGRYPLPMPDLSSGESIETFIEEAQRHLSQLFDRPLPRCPVHDEHALTGRAAGQHVTWVCPHGAWRCPLGDYEELTWPPHLDPGNMAAALCARLARRRITGWRQIGFSRRGGGWVAEVGLWPMDPRLMEQIAAAAAPIPVAFEPCTTEVIRVGAHGLS
jgi:hypothetical protein